MCLLEDVDVFSILPDYLCSKEIDASWWLLPDNLAMVSADRTYPKSKSVKGTAQKYLVPADGSSKLVLQKANANWVTDLVRLSSPKNKSEPLRVSSLKILFL